MSKKQYNPLLEAQKPEATPSPPDLRWSHKDSNPVDDIIRAHESFETFEKRVIRSIAKAFGLEASFFSTTRSHKYSSLAEIIKTEFLHLR